MLIRNFNLLTPCRRSPRSGLHLKRLMAALFRWAACHREGGKRGRGKNRIILSPRFFCLQHFGEPAGARTLLSATSYFRDTVDIWEDLFWDKHEIPGFSLVLFFFFGRDGGRAVVGSLAAERRDTQWMDGWVLCGNVCGAYPFPLSSFCLCFVEQEREREREREKDTLWQQLPVARRLHAYNLTRPSPTHPLFTRV